MCSVLSINFLKPAFALAIDSLKSDKTTTEEMYNWLTRNIERLEKELKSHDELVHNFREERVIFLQTLEKYALNAEKANELLMAQAEKIEQIHEITAEILSKTDG